MARSSDTPFSLIDLGMAYRKAKVDLFYSSHADLLKIAEYEDDLIENLKRLQSKLNQADESWVADQGFIGGWTLVPKAIKCDEISSSTIRSSPEAQWKYICENSDEKPVAEFRIMEKVSMDFHVLSALWIEKVGHQYDACLSDSAWGNRLKRDKKKRLNPFSSGSIKPYFDQFRLWRDKGIRSMQTALDEKKKVIAVTVDAESFYHELDPSFMTDPRFLGLIGIDLTPDEQKLNRIFLTALKEWALKTPLEKGLPVGLPASAIIANMAFCELDRMVRNNLAPVYYGRYVDDIILVLENNHDHQSAEDVWNWIIEQSEGCLSWLDPPNKETVAYSTAYLESSRIWFSNHKNKVFILEGENGRTLIESISQGIQDRASEWRALPNLPDNPEKIAADLLMATQRDGEAADSLRKTDNLTVRRAGFAIKLRDFEAYQRDLSPASWVDHRHAFFHAVIEHIFVLPSFFDLEIYLARIIRMAVSCEDFEVLDHIISKLMDLTKSVQADCRLRIKACPMDVPGDNIYDVWLSQIFHTIEQSMKTAFPVRLSSQGKKNWNTYFAENQSHAGLNFPIEAMESTAKRLFMHDLACVPFKYIKLPKELFDRRLVPPQNAMERCNFYTDLLLDKVKDGLTVLTKWFNLSINAGIPFGLLFSTRPLSLTELYFLKPDLYNKDRQQDLDKIIFALRGYSIIDTIPRQKKWLDIPFKYDDPREKITIALASWETKDESWEASVTKKKDPDITRYQRITKLINGFLAESQSIDYFVMPELSIPPRWFKSIVKKFIDNRISLISGVEYLHRRNKIVRNQIWCAFWHNSPGYPVMAITRQDKQRPAPHEGQELDKVVPGLKMKPEIEWTTPPLIRHGDFMFAMVVCSELTNIGYRASLRGKVDALFVPQWNQDIDSFNALVESAALDIHAFIVQCNNRRFGDSRIRAPYKDSWKRDIIRIRGGITDYYVIGEIDIKKLREFQSEDVSPEKPFKPVPDGFEILPERKPEHLKLKKI